MVFSAKDLLLPTGFTGGRCYLVTLFPALNILTISRIASPDKGVKSSVDSLLVSGKGSR